ncbi:MAG: Unknown protein [uncultured Campylobacterales bacterium]|uniref:TPM domain-containing protein n=1 Tax=uncultured Campylobacterales bacterium TaxID=352960 RepID=A0A6S6S898_9BACT|nr:MAG: Unknown protein [uncultured Campylobacterales bacterium]
MKKLLILFISVFLYSQNLVIDEISLLSSEQKENITKYHEMLLKEYDIDYRVVITNSDHNISLYANENFNSLQKNSLSKSGKALLLVINKNQDTVRLEVGISLEHIYTDMFVSYIEHRQMLPFFRDKKIPQGILGTTEFIFQRIINTDDSELLAIMNSESMGAGAKAKINSNKKNIKSTKHLKNIKRNATPLEILELYIQKSREYNNNELK